MESIFAGGEEMLLNNFSVDLEDLFSDDMMKFLGETDFLAPVLEPNAASPMETQEIPHRVSAASSDSCEQGGPIASRSSGSSSLFQTTEPMELVVQRSAGPPTKNTRQRGPVRLITTQQPSPLLVKQPPGVLPTTQTSVGSELQSKLANRDAAVPACSSDEDNDEDNDSDASNDTDEFAMQKKVNKRKAPEVDWRAISDPAERRRQRRLAKNRMTAARSRERKKSQWAEMEVKLSGLENDNKRLKAMLQHLAQENSMLRGQLEGIVQGEAPGCLKGHSTSAEPAALVFISILLLLCCALPGDQAMLLGSAAPLVLLAHMLSNSQGGQPLVDSFLQFLVSIKTLLARASIRLKASVHKMLFKRHYFVGRQALLKTGLWADASSSWLLLPFPLSSWLLEAESKEEPLPHRIKEEPMDAPMYDDPSRFLICGLL